VSLADYIQSLKNYKGLAGDIVCHKTIASKAPVFASADPELKNNLSFILKALGLKPGHWFFR